MTLADLGPVHIPPFGANINPAKLLRHCWIARGDLAFVISRELAGRSCELHSGASARQDPGQREFKNGICSETRRLSRLTTFIVLLNIIMAHGEIKQDAEGHVGLQGLLKKHPFVPPSV